MRTTNKLTIHRVKKLIEPGRYSDGGGLYLLVRPAGTKSWVFRWTRTVGGKRKFHDMGLGGISVVTLQEAREAARRCNRRLARGLQPRECEGGVAKTFGEVAEEFIKAHRAGWSNSKHAAQWSSTIRTHAAPLLNRSIGSIAISDILNVLKPIWQTKHVTAKRLRSRLERVVDYATARGWRTGENPARWRGGLENLLPVLDRKSCGHMAALPYPEVPGFMKQLRQREAGAAAALELTILTAARTSEVLKATWVEIDLEAGLWIVPAHRMKNNTEHRVPLSRQAIELLSSIRTDGASGFIFPGHRSGRPLSGMSMTMLLRRLGFGHVTVHGFRSSFRDYIGEETDLPFELGERALSHRVGSTVANAYRRGDALERRRLMMQRWADFCHDELAPKIVQIHAK